MPYTPVAPVVADTVIDPAWGNSVATSINEVQDVVRPYSCSLGRVATQAANTGVSTTISWDTEYSDIGGMWTSGANITLPAGGIWGFTVELTRNTSYVSGSHLDLVVDSIARPQSVVVGGLVTVATWIYPLAAAAVITVAFHNTGVNSTVTAVVHALRIGV
jgi:hypothetical protein